MHLRFFIVCSLQALALTIVSYSFGCQRCWFARRPAASSVCCCGHHPPSSDELRLPQGSENLLAPKPKCYGARSSIFMLGVPTVGTHSWKRIQRETVTLVGPMTLEKSLQIRNNRLSTPVTVSGMHSHSKTSKCMIMYNYPHPGVQ